MKKTKKQLEAENKRLTQENNRLKAQGQAQFAPTNQVRPYYDEGVFRCNKCGATAYYDGRCGDGPILMCGCDKSEYSGRDPYDLSHRNDEY